MLGARGETLAERWYTERGFTVLARNWRCREGELDLVLGQAGLVVFCEVKTRRGLGFGAPAEAVSRRKQDRIRVLAAIWLRQAGGPARTLRFDVAAVLVPLEGRARVTVIEGAF